MPTAKQVREWKVKLGQLRKRNLDQQDELLIECRSALNKPGVVFSAVGRECGLNGMTVAKLARSETMRPQFITVLAVLHALGYEIVVKAPSEASSNIVHFIRPSIAAKVAKARRDIADRQRGRKAG